MLKKMFRQNGELFLSEKKVHELKQQIIQNPYRQEHQEGEPVKYWHSTLSKASSERIKKELDDLICHTQFWRDNDVTIERLAGLLDTNSKYLSQLLNQSYQQSFPHFMNELRVKDARQLLIDEEYAHYTIKAIGQIAGFQSHSVFVEAFKRDTGLTPSCFKKSCQSVNV
jgi:AraC-like DNA-binding protein